MTLFLSVPEALSQHPQAEETQLMRQPWTIPLVDATGKSHGYRQSVDLRSGLNILIDDYTLQDDLVVDYGEDKPCAPYQHLEMSFMLSGRNHHEEVQPCHSFILAMWHDEDGGQFHWQAGERVLKFDIHIEPDLFETLVGEQLSALPPLLQQLVQISQPIHGHFRHVQPTTAAMQSVIHQILHCPYQGLTRWLYLESKVMELIALRLDQVIQHPPAALAKPGLHAKDIDRIHYASAILLQRLDNPPSLLELARLVGVNDYKLKQGFRQVFGTTVFGYLQTHRMERAKQLLAEPTLKIAGVAQAMGYANQSYFCRMFKQQFGMTPQCYRNSLRR
ncbi:helix-turn-helix domain-containing protein [Synechococcales cyanobacterium C]|uniref:Helix-turn-helix domain-containing protein n=1 Tax=Petrachloros mirabilis ULC683 TaxID=2781853 RepID=A0A8K2A0L2_9CYAN|nr:AraC family transcriptional regulator [Petrachloros mirabilis]NCJ08609.1 helix-turn-helix domain-containing protein [Petrachloros mirabilis ULC683]